MTLSDEQKTKLFINLARAMALDRTMLRIIRTGRMVGFYHEGGIAMAPGVAAATFLRQDDYLCPHYRAHGIAQMLSKGIDLGTYVAEHMGRSNGCCAGRSSYHFSYPAHGVFGFSGNVGANFPASVGYGYAAKLRKTDQVVMTCSGDGSYGEGRAHEALLMAANWKLPIVFWCENNGVAQYSALRDIFPSEHCSDLAAGYGIPRLVVDGQDLFACGEAALRVIEHARTGKGPYFVECMTLRAQEHNVGGLNMDGAAARDAAQMGEWKRTRDPSTLAAACLLKDRIMSEARVADILKAAESEAERLEDFGDSSPKATPTVPELMAGVYAR